MIALTRMGGMELLVIDEIECEDPGLNRVIITAAVGVNVRNPDGTLAGSGGHVALLDLGEVKITKALERYRAAARLVSGGADAADIGPPQ